MPLGFLDVLCPRPRSSIILSIPPLLAAAKVAHGVSWSLSLDTTVSYLAYVGSCIPRFLSAPGILSTPNEHTAYRPALPPAPPAFPPVPPANTTSTTTIISTPSQQRHRRSARAISSGIDEHNARPPTRPTRPYRWPRLGPRINDKPHPAAQQQRPSTRHHRLVSPNSPPP